MANKAKTKERNRGLSKTEGTKELITKAELAKKLKVTTKTIENWTSAGLIDKIKIGPCIVRYDWLTVLESLKLNNLKQQ